MVVKDLSSLTVSGAAVVEMDNLATAKLEVTMSGAGQIVLDHLNNVRYYDDPQTDVETSGIGQFDSLGSKQNCG